MLHDFGGNGGNLAYTCTTERFIVYGQWTSTSRSNNRPYMTTTGSANITTVLSYYEDIYNSQGSHHYGFFVVDGATIGDSFTIVTYGNAYVNNNYVTQSFVIGF